MRHIQLRYKEPVTERTPQFILRWSAAQGGPGTEIVRQQWNFSPEGSTTEVEDYAVDLERLSVLELAICPDTSQREAVASLAAFLVKRGTPYVPNAAKQLKVQARNICTQCVDRCGMEMAHILSFKLRDLW